eukprot:Rmarinus@m.26608
MGADMVVRSISTTCGCMTSRLMHGLVCGTDPTVTITGHLLCGTPRSFFSRALSCILSLTPPPTQPTLQLQLRLAEVSLRVITRRVKVWGSAFWCLGGTVMIKPPCCLRICGSLR